MDNTETKYRIASPYALRIAAGMNSGKRFPLYAFHTYTIGRSKDCEIVIDESNLSASRKHALLIIERDQIILENLNKNNKTLVRGKAIEKISLREGDQFQIGSMVFELELSGSTDNIVSRIFKKKIILIASGATALLTVILFIIIARSPAPEQANKTAPPIDSPPARTAIQPSPSLSSIETVNNNTSEHQNSDKQKADEHYRQGMFFYDADQLKKAIEQWDRALVLDRYHLKAKQRLLRAESEMEVLIDEHYKNALRNKKYMRNSEAISEFKIVVELSRNKNDERYVSSEKQLRELESR